MANPADIAQQSGQLSGLYFAKQTGKGTPNTTWTDYINTTSFDGDATVETIKFPVLNGSLDEMDQTIAGLEDLSYKLSMPFYLNQGMPFLKGGMGSDTIATTAEQTWGALSAATLANATSFTLTAAPPAPPTGVADWKGAVVQVGTGADVDYTPVLDVSGAVVTCLALPHAHPATDTVLVQSVHCMQPNTGANAANLDWFSVCLEYATVTERVLSDVRVSDLSIKGNTKTISVDLGFVSDAAVQADNTPPIYAEPTNTALANDKPLIMRHGGLITKFAPADAVPVMHTYMTALSFDLKYNIVKSETNNPNAGVVLHTLGGRDGTITLSELAMQYGGAPAMFTNYAASPKPEQPAWLYWRHPTTGATLCIYCSRTTVDKYSHAGPKKDPISYTGSLDVLRGQGGLPTYRIWVSNAVNTQY